MNELKPNN